MYLGKHYVTCGEKSPIWCCKFAMNDPAHECDFAICNVCYQYMEDMQEQSRKREKKSRSRKRTRDVDQDPKECKHDLSSLVTFHDPTYFTDTYLKRRKEHGDVTPTICDKCKKTFTNKSCSLTLAPDKKGGYAY